MLYLRILAAVIIAAVGTGTSDAVHAQSETIAGKARVIDGDTIDIGTTRIRLWGIDAPEGRQQCKFGDKPYLCGSKASSQLAALIGAREVECQGKTRDRYKRIVAVCRIGQQDLGAEMVRLGWALAFVRYSNDYVGQESEARLARRGMWAGTFDPPWEVRQR